MTHRSSLSVAGVGPEVVRRRAAEPRAWWKGDGSAETWRGGGEVGSVQRRGRAEEGHRPLGCSRGGREGEVVEEACSDLRFQRVGPSLRVFRGRCGLCRGAKRTTSRKRVRGVVVWQLHKEGVHVPSRRHKIKSRPTQSGGVGGLCFHMLRAHSNVLA
ncbi:hypothetical protein CRG98_011626 [Punica granatum]|uniref:Uncharacterized protein n=1 Tax=Punica granatum TaxID=22663 RepID=A0A2I0KI99_PUNGR|nr:hypothetical protein CRG98_011626 [Punica granatum]